MNPTLRTRLIACGVVLLALVGAFSAGRFSAPLKTETKTVYTKGETITVHEKGETVYVHGKAETKIVYRDKVITKDGTVTVHEVEKTDTTDKGKVSVVTNSDRAATLTEHGETTVTVTLRPNWRVALQVGASLREPLLPVAGPLVLGAEVDYRIVGGLSAGLWINTSGAAGLSVAFEF